VCESRFEDRPFPKRLKLSFPNARGRHGCTPVSSPQPPHRRPSSSPQSAITEACSWPQGLLLPPTSTTPRQLCQACSCPACSQLRIGTAYRHSIHLHPNTRTSGRTHRQTAAVDQSRLIQHPARLIGGCPWRGAEHELSQHPFAHWQYTTAQSSPFARRIREQYPPSSVAPCVSIHFERCGYRHYSFFEPNRQHGSCEGRRVCLPQRGCRRISFRREDSTAKSTSRRVPIYAEADGVAAATAGIAGLRWDYEGAADAHCYLWPVYDCMFLRRRWWPLLPSCARVPHIAVLQTYATENNNVNFGYFGYTKGDEKE
jgi:hypothetical protein